MLVKLTFFLFTSAMVGNVLSTSNKTVVNNTTFDKKDQNLLPGSNESVDKIPGYKHTMGLEHEQNLIFLQFYVIDEKPSNSSSKLATEVQSCVDNQLSKLTEQLVILNRNGYEKISETFELVPDVTCEDIANVDSEIHSNSFGPAQYFFILTIVVSLTIIIFLTVRFIFKKCFHKEPGLLEMELNDV